MNLRPLGYEPNELPDCSTPRQCGRLCITRSAGRVKPRGEYYEQISGPAEKAPVVESRRGRHGPRRPAKNKTAAVPNGGRQNAKEARQ